MRSSRPTLQEGAMNMDKKILGNLLWKEWREHRMRIAACCAVVGVAAAVGLAGNPRIADIMFTFLLGIAAVVLPMFICMALGAERASGSLTTLLVQPVTPPMVLAVKTLLGLITSVAPVLTIGLIGAFLLDK